MEANILISNDDGIYAPGIMALYQALRGLGRITVVAPASEQSGAGHALTIADPIKVRPVTRGDGFKGFAVAGTPTDCIKLAVCELLPRPPDLIVSGINLGPNVGISVIYSGTVAAAAEGAIMGIPSLAVSLATFNDPRWETAGMAAGMLARQVMKNGLPAATYLNVNVPNLAPSEVKGLRPARMGRSRFAEIFHRRASPRGDLYYWMDGELQRLDQAADTDIRAVEEGWVAVTPVSLDLTDQPALDALGRWCPGRLAHME